jgi:hypothetical protein
MLCRNHLISVPQHRSAPLHTGRVRTWAAGILRVIARANSLDDSAAPLHVKRRDINRACEISPGTGQAQAFRIRKLLKIPARDPQ